MKKLLVTILTIVVMITACACSGSSEIKIGTAGEGGMYYKVGTALGDVLKGEASENVVVKNTAGSAANVRLLSENYLDVAIAQSDIINDAYYGSGTFEESGSYKGYSAIGGIYTEPCMVVVAAESDITDVAQLQDRIVSIGEEESGTEHNALEILSAYGLSDNMLTMKNMTYQDASDALKDGKIDAMFVTAGTDSKFLNDLSEEIPIRVLGLRNKVISKLEKAYGFYVTYTIPVDTYSGQLQEAKTVGVRAVLIVNDKLEDETVEKITRLVFENQKILGIEVSEQEAASGISIPFHGGAASYYAEKNIKVDTK